MSLGGSTCGRRVNRIGSNTENCAVQLLRAIVSWEQQLHHTMDGEEEEELGVEGGGGGGLLQQQSCTGALMMMLDYYNNKSGFPYSSSDLAFLAGLNCSIEESQPVGETNQFILPWWRT